MPSVDCTWNLAGLGWERYLARAASAKTADADIAAVLTQDHRDIVVSFKARATRLDDSAYAECQSACLRSTIFPIDTGNDTLYDRWNY